MRLQRLRLAMTIKNIPEPVLYILLFAGLIFFIWQKNERFNVRYRINRAESQIRTVLSGNNNIRFEVNRTASLVKLEAESNRLGMSKTPPSRFISLENE